MVFNSYTFIVFFVIILILHNLPLPWKTKKINLLLASYVFYAAWNPPFILLLWLSTVVDYFVGRALYTQDNKAKKRLLLVVSLIGNLGMLCFFKYGGVFFGKFFFLCNFLRFSFSPGQTKIIFPPGIFFLPLHTPFFRHHMYHRGKGTGKTLLRFSLFFC